MIRRGGMGEARAGGRVVTGAPYSATEIRQFQERLGDGNLITRTSQIAHYRDSQGRTRTEETITPAVSSGKQASTRTTISDSVAGQMHVLDSATMTARTNKARKTVSRPAVARAPRTTQATRTDPNGATITRVDLGTQVVNGVAATGTQETRVIPAGAIGNAQAITTVRTTWISTELHIPVQIKVVDPQRGNSDMELTNIAQAEPSASLFVVPAGYTEKAAARGGRGAGSGPLQ
jgi:hypothetical protein